MQQSLEMRLPVTNTYCTGRASDSRDLINSLLRQSGKENLPDCIFCGSSMTAHGVSNRIYLNSQPGGGTQKRVKTVESDAYISRLFTFVSRSSNT